MARTFSVHAVTPATTRLGKHATVYLLVRPPGLALFQLFSERLSCRMPISPRRTASRWCRRTSPAAFF